MRTMLTIISFLICFSAGAQSLKKLIEIGDQYEAEGDYYSAQLEYEKAVLIDSVDIHLLFKYAEVLRKCNDHVKAEKYYSKIFGKDRGKIYPIGLFWLAEMQKHNQNYRPALKSWKKAANLFKKDKKSYEYRRARHEGLSTSWAMRSIKDSVEGAEVKNLGAPVNTSDWEFSPLPWQGKLYFSSLRSDNSGPNLQVLDEDYTVKIYSADSIQADADPVKKIDSKINLPATNTATGTFSYDGTRFYFVQAGTDFKSAIYVADYKNGKWSDAKKMEGDINGDFISTHPSYVEIDNKPYLLFSSDRPGGQGKFDLYYAPLLSDKKTGKAIPFFYLGDQKNGGI